MNFKFGKTLNVAFLSLVLSASSVFADDAAKEKQYTDPQELVVDAAKINTEFQEGVHYKVIETNNLSEAKEVREYFSFYCMHCNNFSGFASVLSKSLPQDAKFEGNPVHFLGGPMGVETQKAFAVAKNLNVVDDFTTAVFANVKAQKYPQTREDLLDTFAQLGIDKAKVSNLLDSFPIANMVSQYDQLTQDSRISGVPSVVVNNKYLIVPKSLNGQAEYLALVNYLLNKDSEQYNKAK